MQDAGTQLYPSVVSNLFATGLHQIVFRTAGFGVSPQGTMPVDGADFVDQASMDAMVARTKELGSLGTLVDERVAGDGQLQALCQHPSNPFRLLNFAFYAPTDEDIAVVAHGSLDGERAVWDQLCAPALVRLGISVDPGVVARNAPDGLGVQPPAAGGPADPAMALVFKLQDALRIAGEQALEEGGDLNETEWWKTNVEPLLANPLISA